MGSQQFTCKDGSLTIDASFREDHFCDCLTDGSDETTTGACSLGTFTCPQWPLGPKVVFASRLGDGVCDCCDGADEKAAGVVACEDRCVREAGVVLASFEAKATAMRDALVEKEKLVAEGMEAKLADERELKELEEEFNAIQPQLDNVSLRLKVLEEAEEQRRREEEERRRAEEAANKSSEAVSEEASGHDGGEDGHEDATPDAAMGGPATDDMDSVFNPTPEDDEEAAREEESWRQSWMRVDGDEGQDDAAAEEAAEAEAEAAHGVDDYNVDEDDYHGHGDYEGDYDDDYDGSERDLDDEEHYDHDDEFDDEAGAEDRYDEYYDEDEDDWSPPAGDETTPPGTCAPR